MTEQIAAIERLARALVPRARAGDDEALGALLLSARVPLVLMVPARARQMVPMDVLMSELRLSVLEAVILWQGEGSPLLWVEVVDERLRRRISDYALRERDLLAAVRETEEVTSC